MRNRGSGKPVRFGRPQARPASCGASQVLPGAAPCLEATNGGARDRLGVRIRITTPCIVST